MLSSMTTLLLVFLSMKDFTVCLGLEETDRREAAALFFFNFVTS